MKLDLGSPISDPAQKAAWEDLWDACDARLRKAGLLGEDFGSTFPYLSDTFWASVHNTFLDFKESL